MEKEERKKRVRKKKSWKDEVSQAVTKTKGQVLR
jgi:peptidoglycan hydrolase-like amidase